MTTKMPCVGIALPLQLYGKRKRPIALMRRRMYGLAPTSDGACRRELSNFAIACQVDENSESGENMRRIEYPVVGTRPNCLTKDRMTNIGHLDRMDA